jgi:hypothetical protein
MEIIKAQSFFRFINRMKYRKPKRISRKPNNNDLTLESSYNYNSKDYNSDSFEYTFKPKQIMTTSELKEMREYEECTFQPKVNRSEIKYDDSSVHEKLYTDSKNQMDKKYFKKIEHMRKESGDYTFKPKISKKSLKSVNNTSYDFFENQKKVKICITQSSKRKKTKNCQMH